MASRRKKSHPIKFVDAVEGFLHPMKMKENTRKVKKTVPICHNILPPSEANEQYYLGDICLGRSNNVVPELWTSVAVSVLSTAFQMEFDKSFVVLLHVTDDFNFVKGLFTSKLFAMRFYINQDDLFMVKLFFVKLPITPQTNIVANTIQMAIRKIFSIASDFNELRVDKANIADAIEIQELYRNIKRIRIESVSIPDVRVQHPFLKPQLRPYQEEAVKWMVSREKQAPNTIFESVLHPLYQELKLKSGFILYFNKCTSEIIDNRKLLEPNLKTGGILADEMGLGKTVEVLSCILANPKCESENSGGLEDETATSSKIPTVNQQPKKRKIEPEERNEEYIDKPKRIKVPEDWVKKSSRKSENRVALEMWYENTLNLLSTKRVEKSNESSVQCICGNTKMEGTVRCVDCFKYQHGVCLGFKREFGRYRCPQCWMEQSLLESKATLIVCPQSLLGQWQEEICKHVETDLRVLVYEGARAESVYPTQLKEYDLVLTTYSVLQHELRLTETGQPITLRRERRYCAPGSPLALIKWWRLCLDEAQTVEVSSTMISTMAKKLQAHHRWAITGTPITRDVSDLYGLIDYLQFYPYNELDTWNYDLYFPYLNGKPEAMFQFLAKLMWRSCKKDVIEQINIPSQTTKEYVLEFSAVENYFYNQEHQLCRTFFLHKLTSYDCDTPLRLLNKSHLTKLMAPLKSIRNACTHPSIAKGRYLATRRSVMSMEDLLEFLIEKNLTDCEDNLRIVVSAMNGVAGMYLLLQNPLQAVEEYRKVMHLASRFNSEDSKKGLSVDKLQLIHTVHNLGEVLDGLPQADPTLRDSTLKEHCASLQEKFMEKYINQNLVAYQESIVAINLVSQIQESYSLAPDEWYSRLIDWVAVKDILQDLQNRINTLLDNANNNRKFVFANERKLFYLVATWDVDVTSLRETTIETLNKMYTCVEDGKLSISEKLVQSARDCHLRPEKKTKVNKVCLVCKVSLQMRRYEAKLFDMTSKNNVETEGDISNKGSWKPTSEELVLKGLLSLAKAKCADKELIRNGEVYFNLLDAIKKEFKQLRKFWTHLDQQVCAADEVEMCKIRLGLKATEQEPNTQKSRVDKVLNGLSYVFENKLQYIHLLEAHELEYQMSVVKSEESQNMTALERNLGTQNYLETLRRQQYAGANPDPCPICKNPLEEHWNILQCGHCYCLECIRLILGKMVGNTNRISCSVCRRVQKIQDISYIRTNKEAVENDEVKIQGNYSTKIEGVVKLVLKLKSEEDSVKILIFSTWPAVLNILQSALDTNGISAELIKLTSTLQKRLNNFKDCTKKINILLLPIHLGSKGLNVIEATHVILVEPLLNPADELQAVGRVHRIGQTRPTTVHKFIVKNTIEESLHKATSSNSDVWDKNKVTLQQLKNLFIESLEPTILDTSPETVPV